MQGGNAKNGEKSPKNGEKRAKYIPGKAGEDSPFFLCRGLRGHHTVLKKGEKVVLSGFGTFEVRTRVARSGRNPRTGEEIKVPAQKTPAFKVGKLLKDAINK